jgi:N-carbamoyl-L-amino-acid hydrolase
VHAADLTSRITKAVDARLPLAEQLFDQLRAQTKDGDGVTRASYGAGEQLAHNLMRRTAEAIRLEVEADAAGNLYATLPGQDRSAPRWLSGSHLDSVPQGGNYDGAAGAIAALLSLAVLKDLDRQPAQDVTAMAIRAEECSSWFSGHHGGHLGSRAALGLLAPEEFETAVHIATGRSFGQSIVDAGFDAERVRSGPPQLSPENVRGFVELHIEQGPVLAHDGLPVGIVSGIRGTLRAREVRCIGTYSHSGAVPHELRQDAVLATAELINRLDQSCDRLRADGRDLVFTVGRLHTDAKVDSLTKVSGEVGFTIDIRSQELSVLQRMGALLDQFAEEIASRRNVRFDLGRRAIAAPTVMEARWRSRLAEGARLAGVAVRDMPCGAGHDTAEFVRAGIPACMIFVRNTGESHNPDEHMELADLREGVRLLTWFLATADSF